MQTFRLPFLPLAFLFLLALGLSARATDGPAVSGQPLFNGKDLSGWSPVNDVTFIVTNGALRLVKGMGWLRSERQFSDFILEAEWCALEAGYDSGFFFRAGLDGQPWPKDGWQVNLKDNSLGALVKGYKTVVPAETPRMPVGQWVKFRIEVRGRNVTLDVDGERAWEFHELDATRGYIGIQAENKSFDFRNLRVQELPAVTAAMSGAPRLQDYPFFPFCIDWHDAKKRGFDEQAAMLKELGYEGLGHIWLDKVDERLKSLDAAGLKLFQITMKVDLTPGKPAYDARFEDVLKLINGRRVQFCLLIGGAKPSDASADARGVEVLREMSDLAKDTDAQFLLYPHVNDWIERIEDSVRVAQKVDRPNVGCMFNLCHWLRVDTQRDYAPLLKQAMPRLWAISLNGADEFDKEPGWAHYIQPLDNGTFDMARFLKTLKELGYKGPIGLQCYGIGGDTREHLARSMTAWQELSKNLEP